MQYTKNTRVKSVLTRSRSNLISFYGYVYRAMYVQTLVCKVDKCFSAEFHK